VNREQARKAEASRLDAELTVRRAVLQSLDKRKPENFFCIRRASWVTRC
jgi:hypothetical protein